MDTFAESDFNLWVVAPGVSVLVYQGPINAWGAQIQEIL